MANTKLFRLPEDTSTAVEEFMTKYGLNETFDRLFNDDEVKTMTQKGFEKTKSDVESIMAEAPEEIKEALTNMISENQFYDQEAFTENLRFFMKYVLMKSVKDASFLGRIFGEEITPEFIARTAPEYLGFVLDKEAFQIKINQLHDEYIRMIIRTAEKIKRGDDQPQEEPQKTDEERTKVPGPIRELLDLLQNAGAIEVHVIPICIGGDDGEDSEEDSEE